MPIRPRRFHRPCQTCGAIVRSAWKEEDFAVFASTTGRPSGERLIVVPAAKGLILRRLPLNRDMIGCGLHRLYFNDVFAVTSFYLFKFEVTTGCGYRQFADDWSCFSLWCIFLSFAMSLFCFILIHDESSSVFFSFFSLRAVLRMIVVFVSNVILLCF